MSGSRNSVRDTLAHRNMDPVFVRRRQRGLAVAIAALVLIIGSILYIGVEVATGHSHSGRPKDYRGAGNGETTLVEIKDGSSLSDLGPELVDKDVVASQKAFNSAAATSDKANNVEPGFYKVEKHMSAQSAVDALTSDDHKVEALQVPGGLTLMDVHVVGGQTRNGIYTRLSQVSCQSSDKGNCVSVDDLQKIAANTDPAELGVPEWAQDAVRKRGDDPKRLEGLIAPGTYVIDPNMDAKAALKDLITRSAKKYEDSDIQGRAKALNLAPYQLLTASSLVEREAPAGSFDKVARVILNRLAKPMKLEFDSTVNYDLKDVEVATTDKDRQRQTAWNTYAMEGLPQTPIAAPSDQAIQAMENPAQGNWLYFVTVDKQGTTKFNDTYEGHLKDVDDAKKNGVLDSGRAPEGVR